MSCSEFNIDTYDGHTLYGRNWMPEGDPGAVICIVHGLGEHGGRYAHVADIFNRAGCAVLAADLRGHGKSGGKRGHAKNYTALMDDIYQLLEKAEALYPGTPAFLYGHSLGGNLVIHYALKRLARLSGIIAASPLIRMTTPPPADKYYLLKTFYRIWPSLTVANGLDRFALSRDEQISKAYEDDPLIHDRVSVRWALDMLRAGVWNLRHAEDLSCPMLVMHGSNDQITSPKAASEFTDRAGDRCSFKLWTGFQHELHNDPNRQEVFDVVLGWIKKQMEWA